MVRIRAPAGRPACRSVEAGPEMRARSAGIEPVRHGEALRLGVLERIARERGDLDRSARRGDPCPGTRLGRRGRSRRRDTGCPRRRRMSRGAGAIGTGRSRAPTAATSSAAVSGVAGRGARLECGLGDVLARFFAAALPRLFGLASAPISPTATNPHSRKVLVYSAPAPSRFGLCHGGREQNIQPGGAHRGWGRPLRSPSANPPRWRSGRFVGPAPALTGTRLEPDRAVGRRHRRWRRRA